GSLEYLWGLLDVDGSYTTLWADDHPSERRAFEELVDRIHARLAQHPDMHVFHYASYEVTALRRLAGRYGTREDEVDDLLRRGVEALRRFGPFPLPEPKEAKPVPPEKQERARLRDELEHSGDAALEPFGGLLHYHDRERKPVWWAFFDRIEQSPEELVEDADS